MHTFQMNELGGSIDETYIGIDTNINSTTNKNNTNISDNNNNSCSVEELGKDMVPNASSSPVNIAKMAQLRNERRYEQRKRRIQARFTSDLPEFGDDLEKARKQEGQFLPNEFISFGCVGFSDTQGRRPTMEDTHLIELNFQIPNIYNPELSENGVLLAIFDGHGGIDAAEYVKYHFTQILSTKIQNYIQLKKRLSNLTNQKLAFRKNYISSINSHKNSCKYNELCDDNDSKILQNNINHALNHNIENLGNLLQTILQDTIDLKYEFSLLLKRLSAKLKAPEIEHVQSDQDTDSDSQIYSDSDNENDKLKNTSSKSDEFSIEPIQLENISTIDAIQLLLREAFLEMDECIQQNHIQNGCTGSILLLTPYYAFAANVGDSRILLCRDGKPVRLTRDHRTDDTSEKERIRHLGGYVTGGRVNGILAVTRALGDTALHPFVSSDPSTIFISLDSSCSKFSFQQESISPQTPQTPQSNQEIDTLSNNNTYGNENESSLDGISNVDEFIIVACDGLWDFVSDERAIQEIRDEYDPRIASVKLRNLAFQSGSTDNISVLVFRFNDFSQYSPKCK